MLAFKTVNCGTNVRISLLSNDIKYNEHEIKNTITSYENRFLELCDRNMEELCCVSEVAIVIIEQLKF